MEVDNFFAIFKAVFLLVPFITLAHGVLSLELEIYLVKLAAVCSTIEVFKSFIDKVRIEVLSISVTAQISRATTT